MAVGEAIGEAPVRGVVDAAIVKKQRAAGTTDC